MLILSNLSRFTCNLSSRVVPVLTMEACWEDDEDHCDVRSDASLLRMEVEGYMRPLSVLSNGEVPTWLHWGLGVVITITGNIALSFIKKKQIFIFLNKTQKITESRELPKVQNFIFIT